MGLTRVQTLYLPADDVGATAAFYETIFGAPPRYRDADRWVQFGIGDAGFAIASRDEAATGASGAIVVFETDDVADHDRIVAAGAVPVESRDMGDHGRTKTYLDPAGHLFQLFWRT